MWILIHICLFLHPLKLSKEIDGGIFNRMLFSIFLGLFSLFFDDVSEDGMIYGQSINVVELLDQF